jgi:uncharacterized membrane protein YfcA
MLTPLGLLFVALGLFTVFYVVTWWRESQAARGTAGLPAEVTDTRWPTPLQLGVGFVTNFFDTLGIGSFAPTTSVFKFTKMVPDRLIPGTLNVGHTLPTVAEAFLFIAAVTVEPTTLIALIAASVGGAWLGAGIVAGWSKRKVQIGMGLCLLGAATLMFLSLMSIGPAGGTTLGLEGSRLMIGFVGNFILGVLMTLGIGLYAPCLIMISLLGMSPLAAFPIMMGSCAFLMPVSSAQFVRKHSYARRPSLGLAIGGVPGVLVAFYIVKSLPLTAIRWGVVVVVIYTAAMMLRSAFGATKEQ